MTLHVYIPMFYLLHQVDNVQIVRNYKKLCITRQYFHSLIKDTKEQSKFYMLLGIDKTSQLHYIYPKFRNYYIHLLLQLGIFIQKCENNYCIVIFYENLFANIVYRYLNVSSYFGNHKNIALIVEFTVFSQHS